jgi:hypothetical protein
MQSHAHLDCASQAVTDQPVIAIHDHPATALLKQLERVRPICSKDSVPVPRMALGVCHSSSKKKSLSVDGKIKRGMQRSPLVVDCGVIAASRVPCFRAE